MSIASDIDRYRARQADQATATATIRRPTGTPTTNPSTGAVTQPVTVVGVDVPCKQVALDRRGEDIDAAETLISVTDVGFRLPVATDVVLDDLIETTSSTYNTADVGRTYRVVGIDRREWQISRRVICQEVIAPMDYDDGS